MKKLLKIMLICVAAIVLSVALLVVALSIPPKQYATSGINDYGDYIVFHNSQFASEYISTFFPARIEDTFTDVTYSYKAQNLAEYAFEAYLEFVIEDEKAFHEFISAKTFGLKSKVFSYDPNFVEYTLDDSLRIGSISGEEKQDGKMWITEARIGKILCNTEEHRVIFVALAVRDAWDAYSDFFCCYFDRFHIAPQLYEQNLPEG